MGKFESQSKPGKYYTVTAHLDSNFQAFFSCNCLRWTTSKQNRGLNSWERTCSHCERVGTEYFDAVKDVIQRFTLYGDNEGRGIQWWQKGMRVKIPMLKYSQQSKPLIFAPAVQSESDSTPKRKKAGPKPDKKDRLDYLEL